VWLAFVLMLMIFHLLEQTLFASQVFLTISIVASVFIFSNESSPNPTFCLKIVKNCQHQHKGRPHTQENPQGTSTSVTDSILIYRVLSLSSAQCICRIAWLKQRNSSKSSQELKENH
jgi:hypothetical protein